MPSARLIAYALLSASNFPQLSADLRDQTGIDNGYVRCGGLEFANSDTVALPEEWRGSGVPSKR